MIHNSALSATLGFYALDCPSSLIRRPFNASHWGEAPGLQPHMMEWRNNSARLLAKPPAQVLWFVIADQC
jgi:hypothetical protein